MTTAQWSLTEHLLSSSPDEYKAATQAPFLLAAAEGRLPKDVLGKWLANDRLYIHAYIRAAGQMLATIDLPQIVPAAEASETQLVDWLIEALAAVRREERLFIDVASRYGIDVDLNPQKVEDKSTERGVVSAKDKGLGLVLIEDLFRSLHTSSKMAASSPLSLPWLEGAVMFWGTERCYLDAWSWAKSQQSFPGSQSDREDADGGAMRREFIPNWSSYEFARFVGKLGSIIDHAASQMIEKSGQQAKEEFVKRVEGKWKSLLAAEAAFWPALD
ncbi:hypothetical protein VTK73DRAFT_1285 [Phialemonium thermophilum]|uniref:Thiaminase-2/PQQC domain-containing protein n=1 Tax=Phialemonium thermophilum TaxID=223376 RepID=A0ABR3XA52_9PEZI